MTSLSALSNVLPEATLNAWGPVAAVMPSDGILMGGTALAVHLQHRVSRDLDVFTTNQFDPDKLEANLKKSGKFATTLKDDDTLNGVYEGAKIQFLWTRDQHVLAKTTRVGGINIGSIDDILATKVKVVGDRAELRDYFDLMAIERQAHRRVEEGLQLYMARFDIESNHSSINHIIKGFGYFDDLNDDPYLEDEHGPNLKEAVIKYWQARQPEIIASFDPYAT
ncbi:MAG TPA: nucleotidyl transferase AbiEii/AbiGii toxin family protein [Microthrixaceae bacterium]|nr:nucleotidyl transferase AbiEii/AbiGii toxin family protein [Microthrixaceae bacterium]